MKIRTVLQPGKRGTKALVKEYGSQLICVRYRYDYIHKKKYKTVELIINEENWQPPPPHPDEEKAKTVDQGYSLENKVKIRIAWDEKELQNIAKIHGGLWSPKDRVWLIDLALAKKAGLSHRIVDLKKQSTYK